MVTFSCLCSRICAVLQRRKSFSGAKVCITIICISQKNFSQKRLTEHDFHRKVRKESLRVAETCLLEKPLFFSSSVKKCPKR